MEFGFEVLVRLSLDHQRGMNTSKHVSTELDFNVTQNLKRSVYVDAGGVPTVVGYDAMIKTLVSGLVGCIHAAEHEFGISSAESVRKVIDEITRGFAEVAVVTTHPNENY